MSLAGVTIDIDVASFWAAESVLARDVVCGWPWALSPGLLCIAGGLVGSGLIRLLPGG